jgi:hypothetical protein
MHTCIEQNLWRKLGCEESWVWFRRKEVHIRVLEQQSVVCKDKAIQSEAKGACENELVK